MHYQSNDTPSPRTTDPLPRHKYDEYRKFEAVPLCGDTAATYLHAYDIEPTTKGLLEWLIGSTDSIFISPGMVGYRGGFEGERFVGYEDDIDLALADLLTWELYLGEK